MRRFAMIALVCVTACSSTPDANSSTTSSTPTTTIAPSTTPPPATSTTSTSSTTTSTTTEAPGEDDRWLQDEFPEFDMTVDDPSDLDEFVALVEEFFVWRSWLAAHPIEDPDVLADFAAQMYCRNGVAYETAGVFNDQLIQDGERWVIPPSQQTLTAFHPAHPPTPDIVWLIYSERLEAEVQVLDQSSGALLRTLNSDGGPPTSIEIEWRLGETGSWCVWSVANVT